MSSTWFMVTLAALQMGVCATLMFEGKLPLGGTYLCYAISNILLIFVAKAN